MAVDLAKKMAFPESVPTNLRPDTVPCSQWTKKVIVIELTVPWEVRSSEFHKRKTTK